LKGVLPEIIDATNKDLIFIRITLQSWNTICLQYCCIIAIFEYTWWENL